MNITGKTVKKVTVNGGIPAPTLRFKMGDEAIIHVTNKMKEPTSIHWHGLLIPGAMDGVPGFNGFAGIMPGETFTYRFPIRQTGTYPIRTGWELEAAENVTNTFLKNLSQNTTSVILE